MLPSNPLFTTTSLVWFCCIASLCSQQVHALQPHNGRTRSSPHNYDISNGSSNTRSSRVSPLNPLASPPPSVRVDYARFRAPFDELDLQLGITHLPQDPQSTRKDEWNVPLTKDEFEAFREKHARPGAAEMFVVSRSGAPVNPQQQPKRASLVQPSVQSQPATQTLSKNTQKLVTVACVLAANAGFMNGVGLSGIIGKAQGIAAVTGAFSTAGVAASRAGLAAMATVLLTPFSYMLGSFTNGLWNPNGVVVDNSESSSLRTGPLLLSAAMIMLGNGLLSAGSVHPIVTLTCWTFALGLQNSWTSVLIKGNILRSAHFSGITSDIGTILGQTLRGNRENSWKLPIFAKLSASFWAGGMVSAFMGLRLGISASTCAWMSTCLYLGMWNHLSEIKMPEQLFQHENRFSDTPAENNRSLRLAMLALDARNISQFEQEPNNSTSDKQSRTGKTSDDVTPTLRASSQFGEAFDLSPPMTTATTETKSTHERDGDEWGLLRAPSLQKGLHFHEDDSSFFVYINLKGVKYSEVSLKLDQEASGKYIIHFSGQRKRQTEDDSSVSESKFVKCFPVGDNVEVEKLTANLADGVLTLTAPKKVPAPFVPREIEITSN